MRDHRQEVEVNSETLTISVVTVYAININEIGYGLAIGQE